MKTDRAAVPRPGIGEPFPLSVSSADRHRLAASSCRRSHNSPFRRKAGSWDGLSRTPPAGRQSKLDGRSVRWGIGQPARFPGPRSPGFYRTLLYPLPLGAGQVRGGGKTRRAFPPCCRLCSAGLACPSNRSSLGLQRDPLRVSLGTLETFRTTDNEIKFKALREMLGPS